MSRDSVKVNKLLVPQFPLEWRTLLLVKLLAHLPKLARPSVRGEASFELNKLGEEVARRAGRQGLELSGSVYGVLERARSQLGETLTERLANSFDLDSLMRDVEQSFFNLIREALLSHYSDEIGDFSDEYLKRLGKMVCGFGNTLRGEIFAERLSSAFSNLLTDPLFTPLLRAWLTAWVLTRGEGGSEGQAVQLTLSRPEFREVLLPLLMTVSISRSSKLYQRIAEELRSIFTTATIVEEEVKSFDFGEVKKELAELFHDIFVDGDLLFEALPNEQYDKILSMSIKRSIKALRNHTRQGLTSWHDMLTKIIALTSLLSLTSLSMFKLKTDQLERYLREGGLMEAFLTLSLMSEGPLILPHVSIKLPKGESIDGELIDDIDLLLAYLMPGPQGLELMLGLVEVSESPLRSELQKCEKLSNARDLLERYGHVNHCGTVLVCDLGSKVEGGLDVLDCGVVVVDYRLALAPGVLTSAILTSSYWRANRLRGSSSVITLGEYSG